MTYPDFKEMYRDHEIRFNDALKFYVKLPGFTDRPCFRNLEQARGFVDELIKEDKPSLERDIEEGEACSCCMARAFSNQ